MRFNFFKQQFYLPAATINIHDVTGCKLLHRQINQLQTEAFFFGKQAANKMKLIAITPTNQIQQLVAQRRRYRQVSSF
ncbi:hypothetical protein [Photorhabdus heterorhabditis]|uniref:hypothetical protein n=1 Tax=Photorhabdus heterorhabditis TaxID=880156 RepID=UPI000AC32B65|nr:hypothetical protein [Photorhabdus heterorhabditis]